MIRTTDPDIMKKKINELSVYGGGDIPEMCLSGLQVQHTPLTVCSSEISLRLPS